MKNAPESDVMPLKLKGKLECFQPLLSKKKNRLRRRPGLDTDLSFCPLFPLTFFVAGKKSFICLAIQRGVLSFQNTTLEEVNKNCVSE